ncbi:integrase core domain-containing protein [Acanthopleuribacter pedis]
MGGAWAVGCSVPWLSASICPRALHVIHDRATVFGDRFKQTLAAAEVTTVKFSPRSPNLNAHVERVIRSIREECLDRFVIFSKGQLEYLLREYTEFYNEERPRHGLANRLVSGRQSTSQREGSGDEPAWVVCSVFMIVFQVVNNVDSVGIWGPRCVQIIRFHEK